MKLTPNRTVTYTIELTEQEAIQLYKELACLDDPQVTTDSQLNVLCEYLSTELYAQNSL